jgi:hypothetical protein
MYQSVHSARLLEIRLEFGVLATNCQSSANSLLNYSHQRIFERNRCELKAAEPRISVIFEVRPTKRACRFRQKDEDASISTGCQALVSRLASPLSNLRVRMRRSGSITTYRFSLFAVVALVACNAAAPNAVATTTHTNTSSGTAPLPTALAARLGRSTTADAARSDIATNPAEPPPNLDPSYPGAPVPEQQLCALLSNHVLAASCTQLIPSERAHYVYSAQFKLSRDAELATSLYARFGLTSGVETDHVMNGGYRGMIHIVPEWPTSRELDYIDAAFTHFDAFERNLRARGGKPGRFPRYRWRNLTLRFFRSERRTTPSAYASAWFVAYNVAGSLMQTSASVEETLFHELFHANDRAHGDWAARELAQTQQAIRARCAAATGCLARYAPGSTVVRGGTYYAFQPGNGPEEYAAELAVRFYVEHTAILANKRVAHPWFKCQAPENAVSWAKLTHEMFDDVDLTPACP